MASRDGYSIRRRSTLTRPGHNKSMPKAGRRRSSARSNVHASCWNGNVAGRWRELDPQRMIRLCVALLVALASRTVSSRHWRLDLFVAADDAVGNSSLQRGRARGAAAVERWIAHGHADQPATRYSASLRVAHRLRSGPGRRERPARRSRAHRASRSTGSGRSHLLLPTPMGLVCSGNGPPPVAAAPPQVTEGMVLQAFRRIPLPSLRSHSQPANKTLINFDTIFFTDAAAADADGHVARAAGAARDQAVAVRVGAR